MPNPDLSNPSSSASANVCGPVPARIGDAKLLPCQGLRTLLEFIGASKDLNDFSAERLAKAFGVPVKTYPDDPNVYGYWDESHPDWTWGFEFDKDSIIGPRFEYGHYEKKSDSGADLTDFCEPDFDAFVQALEGLGFTGGIIWGEFGRLDYAQYEKSGLRVQVLPQGESEANAGHTCVLTVIVW